MAPERVGYCAALGAVQKDARLYRGNDIVVIGDDIATCPIKPKRRDIVSCPVNGSKSDIFACGDCGFYVVKLLQGESKP